jgi:2-(1,2-epoxy-1,2-dihydrophenyl)acetyl-CoA isomerase
MDVAADPGAVRVRDAGDSVAIVELDRPVVRNALSVDMLETLTSILEGADERCDALVLTGAGDTFCAGIDSHAIRHSIAEGWNDIFETTVRASHDAVRALLECRVGVVAAVRGFAVGGGATYALLADARVLTHTARIRPGHLAIGSPLDGGSSYALGNAFPPAAAMEILQRRDGLGPAELESFGLCDASVDDGELEAVAVERARRLAQAGADTVLCARQLLRRASGSDFESQWLEEVRWLREYVDSGRLRDRMNAFWKAKA